MFPGMVFAILSTGADFVQDMTEVLIQSGGEDSNKANHGVWPQMLC